MYVMGMHFIGMHLIGVYIMGGGEITGVGRESSSHLCSTDCVRAQVHLAILSLALMIRHTSR
jgi:hypothetical protein